MAPSADIAPATVRSFWSVSVTAVSLPSAAVTVTGWSTGTSTEALAGVTSIVAAETFGASPASTAAWAAGPLALGVEVQPLSRASADTRATADSATRPAPCAVPGPPAAPNPH